MALLIQPDFICLPPALERYNVFYFLNICIQPRGTNSYSQYHRRLNHLNAQVSSRAFSIASYVIRNLQIAISRSQRVWSGFPLRLLNRGGRQELAAMVLPLSEPPSARRWWCWSCPCQLFDFPSGGAGAVQGLLHHLGQRDPLLPHPVPSLGVLEEAACLSHQPGVCTQADNLPTLEISGVSKTMASLFMWCSGWWIFSCRDNSTWCGQDQDHAGQGIYQILFVSGKILNKCWTNAEQIEQILWPRPGSCWPRFLQFVIKWPWLSIKYWIYTVSLRLDLLRPVWGL